MNPEFNKHYGIEEGKSTIEYRFKFYETDEREMHKAIIHNLVEELSVLKLAKDKEHLKGLK